MTNIGNPICCFVSFPIDMSNSPKRKGAERSLDILNDVGNLQGGDQTPLMDLIIMRLSPSLWRWVIACSVASLTACWKAVASATETEEVPRFKAAALTKLASESRIIKLLLLKNHEENRRSWVYLIACEANKIISNDP